jgi:hypothetical protein
MKQIIGAIFIIILLAFAGCIQQQVVEDDTYPNYSKGDKLERVHFILPVGEPRGQEVDLTLRLPDGDTRGTFTCVMAEREVDIYVQETLSTTGNYRLQYNSDNFVKNEYFFVGKTPEKVEFSILTQTLYGNELTLKIRNTGRETGKFYLVIYDNDISTSAGRNVYNREYAREIVNLRFGYDYEYVCNVGSQDLIVLINENKYHLEF